MQTNQNLSPLWLKASVIGSIWAALEIIIGSFLHNLHIPFSGTFMATVSVFLLISFMQFWRDNGIIIRAGIICALMKSLSPSAIIFGPMIGIVLEAFLLELSIFIIGKNIFGYILGGSLAVCSALFQKLASYLIIYGFDILNIATAFYKYLVKQLNVQIISPSVLILSAFVFYAFLGIMAAILGNYYGKRQTGHVFDRENNILLESGSSEKIKIKEELQSNNPFLALILLIGGMTIILFLVNSEYFFASFIAATAYISLSIVKYKPAFRRFKKPGLWIQFFIFTVIAAVSWEWVKTENFYSAEGLIVALKMNFRAIILILGFAAISVELRSPVIRALLTRHGFASVYGALNLSFAALPAILSSMHRNKEFIKQRKNFLANMFFQADNLLMQFKSKNKLVENVFIITGTLHGGKTNFARQVAENLKNKGFKTNGFLSVGIFKNDRRHSFELLNLKNEERILLCSKEQIMDWIKLGHFYFNPKGIEFGKQIIQSSENDEIIFIDEVGKLELIDKKIWYDELIFLKSKPDQIQIWIVRKDYIPLLTENFSISNDNIIDIDSYSRESAVGKIVNKIRN
jgi:nucleoside-triphosphatase THEP1